MRYIQLQQTDELPELEQFRPYKCIVVIEDDLSLERQNQISNLLVSSGCMYMMAWGKNCSSWDDSVDESNLEQFNFGDIPEDSFVITTWHENEPLSEVFNYAKQSATHDVHDLKNCVILHLSATNKAAEYANLYTGA